MRLQTKIRKRSGAYAIEAAFVFPIVFFLLLMIVIGSLGIFRYQECAYLARMGTRFGSVRGDNYWYYQRNLRPPNTDKRPSRQGLNLPAVFFGDTGCTGDGWQPCCWRLRSR